MKNNAMTFCFTQLSPESTKHVPALWPGIKLNTPAALYLGQAGGNGCQLSAVLVDRKYPVDLDAKNKVFRLFVSRVQDIGVFLASPHQKYRDPGYQTVIDSVSTRVGDNTLSNGSIEIQSGRVWKCAFGFGVIRRVRFEEALLVIQRDAVVKVTVTNGESFILINADGQLEREAFVAQPAKIPSFVSNSVSAPALVAA